jgi:hypothetical protein
MCKCGRYLFFDISFLSDCFVCPPPGELEAALPAPTVVGGCSLGILVKKESDVAGTETTAMEVATEIKGMGTVRVVGLPPESCLDDTLGESEVTAVREDSGESMSNGWSSRSSVDSRSWSRSLTFLTVDIVPPVVPVDNVVVDVPDDELIKSPKSESDLDDGGDDCRGNMRDRGC